MKKPLVLIKLGGSAITDKTTPYKARKTVIRRLAREIKAADKNYKFIIAHGSGSYGHTSASKYGGKKGYKSKIGIATVARDASKINQIFTEIFIDEGLSVISLRPMSMILADKGKNTDQFFKVIDEVLDQELIPVVYGDVIWDKSWKSTIFSGEKTLSEIAKYLLVKGEKIEKVIEIGETEGVLDENGKTIPEINSKNWKEIKKNIFKTNNKDVTGGIEHKVEEALGLSKLGIKTVLISSKENNLYSAIMDRQKKATIN